MSGVGWEEVDMWVSAVTLVGRLVHLEPLQEAHVPALFDASDPSVWRYLPYGPIDNEAALRALVRRFLDAEAHGTDLPFSVWHVEQRRLIGMTRYLHIDPPNLSLEIGGTWYAKGSWGTGVNTESKYLLLQHAFEELGCERVQLKADVRNHHSQHAILSLGAVREGVLRHHLLLPDGTPRDSVYFSVLREEWPRVAARLRARLVRLGVWPRAAA